MSAYPSALRIALLVATSAAVSSTAPAYAFADDDARRAILDLREQVHQMAEQGRRIRLDFSDQLESLKQEVITLRGQLEQLKWASNMNQRSSQYPSAEVTAHVADPQEQAAYESAKSLFSSGKYKESIDGFTTFLSAYPHSQLASEARFYRGSSQYATKDFRGSIAGLEELISSSPQDPRAANALLIIASAQIELDNMAATKATLQRIVNDYPDSSAAQTAKERLKLL